ncbi:MAG: hypothetical protein M3Z06_15325 [Actinomycetota bacterium]|nr:hypothetical protein [Actinomycetota bacterium]
MKRLISTLGIAVSAATMLLLPTAAGAKITGLPLRNPHATVAPVVPQSQPAAPAAPLNLRAPITGASWAGVSDSTVTPPDTNGAIGPNSYVEIINLKLAIYTRTGATVSSATLGSLTGHSQFNLSDPMVLWDPNTLRFYYNVWDTSNSTMAWGFSKTSSPTAIPSSFCNYTSAFGYTSSEAPDYPKLGQSNNFLMIGVNHYPSVTAARSDRSDLLWIDKPQGSAPISTCPAASTFLAGKFANLRNANGTQAFTPVPAIQDDGSTSGWVVTETDIECPGVCGTGNRITVHTLTPSTTNPKVPVLTVTGHSITVPTFAPPATTVPQRGSTRRLDPLDGRLEHAVAAIDPSVNKEVIWTGHNVNGAGNRTEFRWYEILPTPAATPTLISSGVVNSPSLYVFNGALAPDRTVNSSGAAHGQSVTIGFSTSSATTLPADQMVSKIGAGALSPFVLVHQSTTADNDFSCNPGPCRWGDYGGATSDPAQRLTAGRGEAWFTNESVTAGSNTTWNWEAKP